MTLSDRIKGCNPGTVLDLGDEPMGDQTVRIGDGRGVKVRGGRFDYLKVMETENLHFEAFEGKIANPKPTYMTQLVRLWNCKGISFAGPTLRGGIDPLANAPAGQAFYAVGSERITCEDADVEGFHKGFIFAGTSQVELRQVHTRLLRTTAFSFAGASHFLLAKSSHTDSRPLYQNGEHADVVHLWTTDAPIAGVEITDNVFDEHDGDFIMGIYLDDNRQSLGYIDPIITGNRLNTSHLQGILIEHGQGGTISDNELIFSGNRHAPVKTGLPGNVWPTAEDALYHNAPRIVLKAGTRGMTLENNRGEAALGDSFYALASLTDEERASLTIRQGRKVPTLDEVFTPEQVEALEAWHRSLAA